LVTFLPKFPTYLLGENSIHTSSLNKTNELMTIRCCTAQIRYCHIPLWEIFFTNHYFGGFRQVFDTAQDGKKTVDGIKSPPVDFTSKTSISQEGKPPVFKSPLHVCETPLHGIV